MQAMTGYQPTVQAFFLPLISILLQLHPRCSVRLFLSAVSVGLRPCIRGESSICDTCSICWLIHQKFEHAFGQSCKALEEHPARLVRHQEF